MVLRLHGGNLFVCQHLWCTFSLSYYVIQVVGDVCIQSTSQVPGLTDPVVILSPETHTETSQPIPH